MNRNTRLDHPHHHPSNAELDAYFTGRLDAQQSRLVSRHLQHCQHCARRQARLVPLAGPGRSWFEQAQPSAHYIIDWVLTQAEAQPHSRYRDWRVADFDFLGMDRPGLVARIASLFRDHEANIERIEYTRSRADARYYHLHIRCVDNATAVERALNYFQKHRLAYSEFPAAAAPQPLVTVVQPLGLDVEVLCEDDLGLVAELSNLVAAECLFPQASQELCYNGSFLNFSGRVENGGFAEAGTPVFHVQARVAAARPAVVDRIRTRLEQFRCEHPVSGFSVTPIGRLPTPARFLAAAHHEQN